MARGPAADSEEISAIGLVLASPDEVFSFLSDLENHWLLADRFIEVVSLDRGPEGTVRGGQVRIRGPLGLHRTATTRVVGAAPGTALLGIADLGGGTRADVRWLLTSEGRDTRVELTAHLKRTGWLDRFLLAVGGRHWLRRRFASILTTLALRLESPTRSRLA